MTAPIRQSASVTPNNFRSGWRVRGILIPSARRRPRPLTLPALDELLEDAPAVLEILELVEAGASRSEQNGVAGPRAFDRHSYRALERFRAVQRDRISQLRSDFFGGGADQKGAPRMLAERSPQQTKIPALVFPAQDDEQRARKSFQGLERGVHIGGF